MINHALTLLMNRDGQGVPTGDGEEYTLPQYREVVLTGDLVTIRSVLFGTHPDRRTLVYRVRQYLTLLHSTELDEYVLALDPRITYLPWSNSPTLQDSLTAVPVNHESPLTLEGNPPTADGAGRSSYTWTVEVAAVSGASATLDVERLRPGFESAVATVPFSNHLSVPFSLPGSPLFAACRDDVQVGDSWIVEALVRPSDDLGVVAARLALVGHSAIDNLFGTSLAEPYQTWRKLWSSNRPLPYRLGGVLLALIYRTEAIRTRKP